MSTLKDFKNKYVGLMSESGIENAAFDFDYVVQEEGNITRFDLLANPDMEIYSETEKKLSEIFLRYIKGEPLQYILGYTYFMNGKFKVAPGVLIPRSDTEVVVEQALEYIKNHENSSVLDLCCGSGCIGLSIAETCHSVNVCLCDISPIAVEITTENSSALGLNKRTEILEGNLFEALSSRIKKDKFQMIISNPPYISREIVKTLEPRVKNYEPTLALDGGEDGLDFYRAIVKEAPKHLLTGGMLIFEIGYDQADSVADLMTISGEFSEIKTFKDYGGNFRGVSGLLKGN